jgi:hypothetical protein
MALALTGKITQVIPEKSGTSARGPWRKQEYVLEIPGDYPKQVCFMVWGDKIDQLGIQQGQEVTVHFDLESREYNGRWYTDVKAWRVEPAGAAQGTGHDDGFDQSGGQPPMFGDEPPF